MCERFNEWREDIAAYCKNNNLDFEKAKGMVKCWNEDSLVLQYYDAEKKSGDGLLNETPMPVVLWITREEDGLKFEKTEYTQEYLAI